MIRLLIIVCYILSLGLSFKLHNTRLKRGNVRDLLMNEGDVDKKVAVTSDPVSSSGSSGSRSPQFANSCKIKVVGVGGGGGNAVNRMPRQ